MVYFEPFGLRGLWMPCMVFSWYLCDRSWLVPSFLAFLSLVKVKYVIKLFLKLMCCVPFPHLCCLCGNDSLLLEGDLGEKIKTSHRCTRQQQQREREREIPFGACRPAHSASPGSSTHILHILGNTPKS